MEYHKLVRDRIPEIIEGKGDTCVVRVAGEDEFRTKLQEKLWEEIGEFLESGTADELAPTSTKSSMPCARRII